MTEDRFSTLQKAVDEIHSSLKQVAADIVAVKVSTATTSEWIRNHDLRHDRESGWSRWIVPTVISIGSFLVIAVDKLFK